MKQLKLELINKTGTKTKFFTQHIVLIIPNTAVNIVMSLALIKPTLEYYQDNAIYNCWPLY